MVAVALTGCAELGELTETQPTQTASGGSVDPVTDPAACGGQAVDLDSALRLVTDPAGCPGAVNTLWTEQIGNTWTPTTIIEYHDGEVPPIACATAQTSPEDFAGNALYCPADDTVAYSVEFMSELYDVGGAEYPLFVLLHEIAHRANHHADAVGVVSRAEENQADCGAGYQAKYADDAGRMNIGDALEGFLLFLSLGDTRGGWFDNEVATAPDAHGTPRQRAQSFLYGYVRDFDVCRGLGQSPTGSVLF